MFFSINNGIIFAVLVTFIHGTPKCIPETHKGTSLIICDKENIICLNNCSLKNIKSVHLRNNIVYPDCKEDCLEHCVISSPWSLWKADSTRNFLRIRQRVCETQHKVKSIQLQWRKPLKIVKKIPVKRAVKRRKLPRKIRKQVEKTLKGQFFNFKRKEGEVVRLNCDNIAARSILRKYPKAGFRFIHNNKPMKIETDRMMFRLGILSIQSLASTDQGVYMCEIEYEPRQVKTVALFSIFVTDGDLEIAVKETKTLSIKCNSVSIARLFKGSVRIWRDEKGKPRSNPIDASIERPDLFTNVKKSSAGQWTCHVKHKDSKRVWQTASYKVIVDPPPTKYEKYYDEIMANKFKYGCLFSGVGGLIFVMCFSFLYQTDKARSSESSRIEILKKQLKRLEGITSEASSEPLENNPLIAFKPEDEIKQCEGDDTTKLLDKEDELDMVDEKTKLLSKDDFSDFSESYIHCGLSAGANVTKQLSKLKRNVVDNGRNFSSRYTKLHRRRNHSSRRFPRLARNIENIRPKNSSRGFSRGFVSNQVFRSKRNIDLTGQGNSSHGSLRRRRKLEIKQTPLRPALSKYIDDEFERLYYAFTEYVGRPFSFNCNSQLTNMIRREFTRSVFRFVHNDKPISKKSGRYSGVLRFRKLKSKDGGVYLCQIEYEKNLVKTFALFTLLVKNSKDERVRVRETESMSLACHSIPMSHFYPQSKRIWRNHKNKPRSKKYPANKSNNDTFSNVKRSKRGQWICWVEDARTYRKWPIAWYRVYVDPPPTDNDKLIMSIQRNIMLVIGFVIGTLGLMCVMCFSLLYRGNSPSIIAEEDVEILDNQEDIDKVPPDTIGDKIQTNGEKGQRISQIALEDVDDLLVREHSFNKVPSYEKERSFERNPSIDRRSYDKDRSFIFSDQSLPYSY